MRSNFTMIVEPVYEIRIFKWLSFGQPFLLKVVVRSSMWLPELSVTVSKKNVFGNYWIEFHDPMFWDEKVKWNDYTFFNLFTLVHTNNSVNFSFSEKSHASSSSYHCHSRTNWANLEGNIYPSGKMWILIGYKH